MYEIELKAHVYNHATIQTKLHSFAQFFGKCEKTDVYWQQTMPYKNKTPVEIRIREQKTNYPDGNTSTKVLVTYKRKELRYAQSTGTQNTTAYEVNDEQEFTINARKPFEIMLNDAGFQIASKKHKIAMQWKHDDVFLELCTIHGLGDFLELEIMSEDNSPHTAETARAKLEKLLTRCDIPLEHIEPKYYSVLLKEVITNSLKRVKKKE